VSGSGKSTLVNEVIYKALANRVSRHRVKPGAHRSVHGFEAFDKVIDIDQSPIGRTPRSNPATYTGLFDHIRALYAQTPESRARGYKAGRFSFNVKGGRCETCRGDGTIKIEMHFLPDVYVPCEVCKGRRYNDATLRVQWKGKSIAQVLDTTVTEAMELFPHHRTLSSILHTLDDVGLGYLSLDRPTRSLSGGETERVSLTTCLGTRLVNTLFVLDEPSVGLHSRDTERLVRVLEQLRDAGNTVLVVEHEASVMRAADQIVDLGPGHGSTGGHLVFQGPYDEILNSEVSLTGQYLSGKLSIPMPLLRRKGTGKTLMLSYLASSCPDHTVILLNARQMGLIVSLELRSGSRHRRPLGESLAPPQVVLRNRMELRQVERNEPGPCGLIREGS
jgi:excinuclease ABC subunit A